MEIRWDLFQFIWMYNMPAKSKSQFRFMKAIEGGYIKKPGLSKKKAKEFTSENKSLSSLPEKKSRFKRINNFIKGSK